MSGPHMTDRHSPSDPAIWLETHGDALFRYALIRVRDRATAEDLVQETLLAALSARSSFAGQSTERTWLIGILKRKIVDSVRRESRERTAAMDLAGAEWVDQAFDTSGHWREGPRHGPTDPARDCENREFWVVFFSCVSKLPRTLGGVFALREMEQLSTEEICKVLEITASNLWTRLHRSRMLLRRCLEAHWFAGPR